MHKLSTINNLRNSAIQSEEIILILRMFQRRSLSEHDDSKSWRIDSKSWCPERQVQNAKQARVLHRAHERLSIYAMIVMPEQIKILSQGKIENECRSKLNKVFLYYKLHLTCIKMSNIAIINGNNNFALCIFRSLCEFVGDCFEPLYFSSGATLSQKVPRSKQSPLISHNDLKKMVNCLKSKTT